MAKVTVDYVREKLNTDDRWLLIGLITIYKHQTIDEQRTRTNGQSNGVGFTGPDANVLTSIAQYLLSRHTEQAIRLNFSARLEHYLDKPWAIETVRKRMPKYAGQLTRIANKQS